jgi:5-methylcytosine-specific restriction endonuclease McrA
MSIAMTDPVLVLNKNWQAIHTVNLFEAVCKVFTERAVVIDEDYSMYDFEEWIINWEDAIAQSKIADNRVINSPSASFVAPEVIRLVDYGGYIKYTGFNRRNVFLRDCMTCQYCAKKFPRADMTLDHVFPKSRGGETNWENIVLACFKCNNKKRDRTPAEAGMRLLNNPKKPHWTQLRTKPMKSMPKSWEKFLGELYWNAELEN